MSLTQLQNNYDQWAQEGFDKVLEDQLTKWTKDEARDDFGADQAVGRWLSDTKGTQNGSLLIEAIYKALESVNISVRTGAAAIVEREPEYFDPDRIIEVLERSPKLFQGVKPDKNPSLNFSLKGPDLRSVLMRSLGLHNNFGPKALEYMKQYVADPDFGVYMTNGIAYSNPEWIAEDGLGALGGRINQVGGMLKALPSQHLRLKFIGQLSSQNNEDKQNVRELINEARLDSKERQRLLDVLGD